MTFGPLSSLERIGVEAFGPGKGRWDKVGSCGLVEISIPDSVVELCDRCFIACRYLRRVTFGPSSSLKRIGVEAFGTMSDLLGTSGPFNVVGISIPDSVVELCDLCFVGCCRLRYVEFSPLSSLERIGFSCFCSEAEVEDFAVPDGVCEMCDRDRPVIHRALPGRQLLVRPNHSLESEPFSPESDS